MDLTKEKAIAASPNHTDQQRLPQEMLKGLCFNCDHRKYCTWKENRKLFCEHFQ
jgi:hypothetical protein